MQGDDRSGSWWKTLPGVLTATAAVVTATTGLIVALHQIGVFDRNDPAPAQAVSSAPSEPSGAPTGAHSAGSASAVRLGETELRVGPVRYSILDTQLERYSESMLMLRLSMRFTNVEIQWGVAIGPTYFRLFADDVPLEEPPEAYIGVVSHQSAQQGDVVSTFPADTHSLALQLGELGKDVRRIPIELTGAGD